MFITVLLFIPLKYLRGRGNKEGDCPKKKRGVGQPSHLCHYLGNKVIEAVFTYINIIGVG
jgi:hypothetical protein